MMGVGLGPRSGGGLGAFGAVPAARYWRSSPVALVSATPLDILWNAETYERGITHDTVVNPQNITIVTPGIYDIVADLFVQFTTIGAAGVRLLTGEIRKNGTAITLATYINNFDNDGDTFTVPLHDRVVLVAADILTIRITVSFGAGAANLIGLQSTTFVALGFVGATP